jgi:hypothetical protein
LRRLYYPEHPLEIFPLQFLGAYDAGVELSREVATIVMLLTVAALAERSSLTRCFAVFVYMFGIWDIFYYVWLKVLMGWPTSWLEWDVLFLIPIVWLGPWICPAVISLLFIAWGWWTLRSSEEISFTAGSLSLFLLGSALGLLAFFQPAAAVLMSGGVDQLSRYTPGDFWWWLFTPGLIMMACGLGLTLRGAKSTEARRTSTRAPLLSPTR